MSQLQDIRKTQSILASWLIGSGESFSPQQSSGGAEGGGVGLGHQPLCHCHDFPPALLLKTAMAHKYSGIKRWHAIILIPSAVLLQCTNNFNLVYHKVLCLAQKCWLCTVIFSGHSLSVYQQLSDYRLSFELWLETVLLVLLLYFSLSGFSSVIFFCESFNGDIFSFFFISVEVEVFIQKDGCSQLSTRCSKKRQCSSHRYFWKTGSGRNGNSTRKHFWKFLMSTWAHPL